MHRARLASIMQAASGCRLSWKYFIEEPDNISVDEVTKLNEEKVNTTIDYDSEHSESKIEETNKNEGLGRLYLYICATILENTITEMKILDKRYEAKEPAAEDDDELSEVDFSNIDVSDYKIRKHYADRSYFTGVIKSLYKELALNKSFTSLTNCLRESSARRRYLFSLKDDENKNKMSAKELNKQVRQQRIRFKIESYEKQTKILTLQNKIRDSKLYSEIGDRYVDNWQGSRTEQHSQVLCIVENKQSEAVESFKQKYNNEYRAHSEFETYLNIAIHDTYDKIDQLIDKYEKEKETMDLKIQIKKHAYLSMYEDRIRLEETVKKRDNFIKKWKQYKENREKLRMYPKKMHKSACIVQAWWRGLLVRRQLGPYKVKTVKLRR